MIYKDNTKQVVAIYKPQHGVRMFSLKAIYKGARLVWEAISSCYGRGFWDNLRPWSNTDAWKNS